MSHGVQMVNSDTGLRQQHNGMSCKVLLCHARIQQNMSRHRGDNGRERMEGTAALLGSPEGTAGAKASGHLQMWQTCVCCPPPITALLFVPPRLCSLGLLSWLWLSPVIQAATQQSPRHSRGRAAPITCVNVFSATPEGGLPLRPPSSLLAWAERAFHIHARNSRLMHPVRQETWVSVPPLVITSSSLQLNPSECFPGHCCPISPPACKLPSLCHSSPHQGPICLHQSATPSLPTHLADTLPSQPESQHSNVRAALSFWGY